MSVTSQRRQAEQRVIAAARLLNIERLGVQAIKFHQPGVEALHDAVEALDALELELPGKAKSSRGAPLTSQQAAAYMDGDRARSVAARIVRMLYDFPVSGFTVDELMRELGTTHQSTSARVHELDRHGWVVGGPDTRPTRSGQQALVWRLTLAARRLCAENRRARPA